MPLLLAATTATCWKRLFCVLLWFLFPSIMLHHILYNPLHRLRWALGTFPFGGRNGNVEERKASAQEKKAKVPKLWFLSKGGIQIMTFSTLPNRYFLGNWGFIVNFFLNRRQGNISVNNDSSFWRHQRDSRPPLITVTRKTTQGKKVGISHFP